MPGTPKRPPLSFTKGENSAAQTIGFASAPDEAAIYYRIESALPRGLTAITGAGGVAIRGTTMNQAGTAAYKVVAYDLAGREAVHTVNISIAQPPPPSFSETDQTAGKYDLMVYLDDLSGSVELPTATGGTRRLTYILDRDPRGNGKPNWINGNNNWSETPGSVSIDTDDFLKARTPDGQQFHRAAQSMFLVVQDQENPPRQAALPFTVKVIIRAQPRTSEITGADDHVYFRGDKLTIDVPVNWHIGIPDITPARRDFITRTETKLRTTTGAAPALRLNFGYTTAADGTGANIGSQTTPQADFAGVLGDATNGYKLRFQYTVLKDDSLRPVHGALGGYGYLKAGPIVNHENLADAKGAAVKQMSVSSNPLADQRIVGD